MRTLWGVLALCAALIFWPGGGEAYFAGPGPGLTGNDTGGIIPYSPAVDKTYKEIAASWCARWNRMSHVTSVRRQYGDYISFVCVDKPWMIH